MPLLRACRCMRAQKHKLFLHIGSAYSYVLQKPAAYRACARIHNVYRLNAYSERHGAFDVSAAWLLCAVLDRQGAPDAVHVYNAEHIGKPRRYAYAVRQSAESLSLYALFDTERGIYVHNGGAFCDIGGADNGMLPCFCEARAARFGRQAGKA